MSNQARLVLFTPFEPDAASLPQALAAAFDAAAIDAVILRLPETDDRSRINLAKAVAPIVQGKGAALMLAGYPELVARSGADGAHVTGLDAVGPALEILRGQERMCGVGGLPARHDAMEAAELGTDYVMFGEPRADGSVPPLSGVIERAQWWAELFHVPCVAYAPSLEDVAALAATGAEFVALGDYVFRAEIGISEAVKQAAAALAEADAPAP
ncbi:MAG: thiamine phosphate synthase [Beijerinckiaceae bacterium]|nr:thiamine phosphate synthase [Beijerinckiaceae bacterium]